MKFGRVRPYTMSLADRRADNSELQFGLLEKEVDQLKKYRTDAIVYKSILQDTNRHIEISKLEKKGRLVLFNLENGHKPKNKKEGEQWLSILEENKKAKTIFQKRLEASRSFYREFKSISR